MSTFLREDDEYVRNVDVINEYIEQTVIYLTVMTKRPEEEVRAWIKEKFSKGGKFEIITPSANITVRDKETGDRRRAKVDMGKLFKILDKYKLIVSPSMTFYIPAEVKRSLLSIFIDENIQKRAKVKREMQAAQSNGDFVLAANKKNAQNSLKQRNNAMSGAHSSPYTILYNKSTHSSLTSLCRSATSYGNANNEKVLASSRHYWAPGIVVNNILATIRLTDFNAFTKCMEYYNLHVPTVQETMQCIRRSADLYWNNENAVIEIKRLVESISDIQRAAFVYIGDLYQLRRYNDGIVRTMISEILDIDYMLETDASVIEKRLDGDTVALVSLIAREFVTGDFKRTKKEKPEQYKKLLAAASHIFTVLDKYDLLIKEILTTENVPASIAKLPDVIRRVSLVSDTDSTMATAMSWAEWYCGEGITTGKLADDVSDLMIYMATQNIAHMMARMSTNIGVEKKYTHRYAMKNEFKFSSFALTNKAKHYFSLITSQEGVVKPEPELEMKGVALRTSNIPPIIMDEYRNQVTAMLDDVMNGRNIKLIPLLNHIANTEHAIEKSVYDGEYTYLTTGNIKPASSYSEPAKSKYRYHKLWEEVWAPKYGHVAEPPYNVVKLSVNLNTVTAVKRWLEGMKDQALAKRMRNWCATSTPSTFINFLLPDSIVASNGIPREMIAACDFRKIKFTSVEPYYHVLESLGVVMIEKNRTKLLSDYYGTRLVTEDC